MTSIQTPPKQHNDQMFLVDLADGLTGLHDLAHRLTCDHNPPPEIEQNIDRDLLAAELCNYGDFNAAKRLQHCEEGGLGWVGVCSENMDHKRIYIPYYCELRICPKCAARRSRAMAAELTDPIIEYTKNVAKWRGYRMRHVTLTTRYGLDGDIGEVAQQLSYLRRGIRLLFKAMFPADPYLGGLVSAEFGEEGRKLHFHVLLFSRWIDRGDLGERWRDLTGGDGLIYWIQEVKRNEIHKGVLEVCKYATKPAKFAGENLEQLLARLHMILKGRRRMQTFGSFYNLERRSKSDMVCQDCGARLDWLPELITLQEVPHESSGEIVRGNLDLILTNKLIGPSPPEQPNNLQLPFKGAIEHGF